MIKTHDFQLYIYCRSRSFFFKWKQTKTYYTKILFSNLVCLIQKKQRITSFGKVCVLAKIRTEYFTNTSQKRHCLS
jgi:hypothetical protein